MNEITAILQHPHVEHLALTLIHFVWQGLIVAGLVYVGLKVLSNHAPKVRYRLALVGLLILVASPIATFCLLATTPPLPATGVFEAEVDPASLSLATTVVGQSHRSNPPATWKAVSLDAGSAAWAYGTIVVIWLGGVLFFSLRLALGLRQVRRLVSEGTTVLAQPLQRVLNKVLTKAEVRRPVIALQSLLVEVPTVIGWLKPCILLPASILVGLPVQHLEALLAHEVVHIKRWDYLVNLAQHIIEALLFYHPATWWISNQVRIEREQCCDDAAADLVGHRSLYIEALARLEFTRGEISEPALAATGGSLVSRLRRLTTPERPVNHPVTWLAGIASLSILFVVTTATVPLLPHSVANASVTGELISFQAAASPPSALQVRLAKKRGVQLKPSATPTYWGVLYRPQGEGPFPAVVFVETCWGPMAGNTSVYQPWIDALTSWRYVVLRINRCIPNKDLTLAREAYPLSWGDLVFAAYGAFSYLSDLSFVDRTRIGVMGWSIDGTAALSAVNKAGAQQLFDRKFRAAVAFYPYCRGDTSPFVAPVMVLVGAKDDWALSRTCQRIGGENSYSPVEIKIYPNAVHGFDLPAPVTRPSMKMCLTMRKILPGVQRQATIALPTKTRFER
ncbi:MAG: M56 family metallopeptidase [Acidiferrobacterales bacterium]